MISNITAVIDALCKIACSEASEYTINELYNASKLCGLKTKEDFRRYGLNPLYFWAVEAKKYADSKQD